MFLLPIWAFFTVCLQGVSGKPVTCDPTDAEEILGVCDNTKGRSMSKCEFALPTGVTIKIDNKEESVTDDNELKNLATSFKSTIGTSKLTGYNWSNNSEPTFSKPETGMMELQLEPGNKALFVHVVGYCGPYTVKTTRVLSRDYNISGNFIDK